MANISITINSASLNDFRAKLAQVGGKVVKSEAMGNLFAQEGQEFKHSIVISLPSCECALALGIVAHDLILSITKSE